MSRSAARQPVSAAQSATRFPGAAYVYQAMRVTGGGKSPKARGRNAAGQAAAAEDAYHRRSSGYSSYGNQIGLATGLVDEIYHDGYAAKRMEIGAWS